MNFIHDAPFEQLTVVALRLSTNNITVADFRLKVDELLECLCRLAKIAKLCMSRRHAAQDVRVVLRLVLVYD